MTETIVVSTTVNVPHFIELLCRNAIEYNRKDSVSFIIIGDLKTPKEVRSLCEGFTEKFKMNIRYLDIDDQEDALKNYKELWKLIPFNDGVRKIIGTFLAYMEGCDRLIMVDDDNFPIRGDFFGSHNIVGANTEIELITSDTGWYNVAEAMVEKNRIPFYARGYPWPERFKKSIITKQRKKGKVVSNCGMVLGDPDVDAVSRLFWPIKTIAMDSRFEPNYGLGEGTWAPFNDQNTAICREIMPVFFRPPSTGRNCDIWTSYVIVKLAEHMGDIISYGHPLVRQDRNIHDDWEDYEIEDLANRATELFVTILRNTKLTADTYEGALEQLIRGGLDQVKSLNVDDLIVTSKDENRFRGHQLPTEKVKIDWKKKELVFIQNFFLEYEKWQQFISRVRN